MSLLYIIGMNDMLTWSPGIPTLLRTPFRVVPRCGWTRPRTTTASLSDRETLAATVTTVRSRKFPVRSSLAAHDRLTGCTQLNACGSLPRSWEWPALSQPRAARTSSAVTLPLVTGLARSPTKGYITVSSGTPEDNFSFTCYLLRFLSSVFHLL